MTFATLPDPLPTAIGRGGPMDGRALGAAGPDEYVVSMADGSRWTYRRTAIAQTRADTPAVLYECAGRT